MRLSPTTWRTGWIVWWVALFVIMHTPKLPRIHSRVDHVDKLFHFAGYAMLAWLCTVSARARGTELSRGWFGRWTAAFAGYAVIDELLQPIVGRSTDPWDWLADMTGVVAAFLLVHFADRPGRTIAP